MPEHMPSKTAEDLVSEIVCDDISTIEDLVLSNDRITLEEWLTPLLTSDLRVRMGLAEGEPFTYEKVREHYEKHFDRILPEEQVDE